MRTKILKEIFHWVTCQVRRKSVVKLMLKKMKDTQDTKTRLRSCRSVHRLDMNLFTPVRLISVWIWMSNLIPAVATGDRVVNRGGSEKYGDRKTIIRIQFKATKKTFIIWWKRLLLALTLVVSSPKAIPLRTKISLKIEKGGFEVLALQVNIIVSLACVNKLVPACRPPLFLSSKEHEWILSHLVKEWVTARAIKITQLCAVQSTHGSTHDVSNANAAINWQEDNIYSSITGRIDSDCEQMQARESNKRFRHQPDSDCKCDDTCGPNTHN